MSAKGKVQSGRDEARVVPFDSEKIANEQDQFMLSQASFRVRECVCVCVC